MAKNNPGLRRKLSLFAGVPALVMASAALLLFAPTAPALAQPNEIPTTDAQSGPCSVELTVTGTDGKPVYAARVDYQTAYGFMGTHKLDMTGYTNVDGKTKFTGIPAKVRRPPIEFHASKGDLFGVATVDPAAECQAKHDVVMDKKK